METTTEPTDHDDDTEATLRLFDAHQQRIQAPWKAAFAKPAPQSYEPGAIVWLVDHYNTGKVIGPATVGATGAGRSLTRFEVESRDTDGKAMRMTYPVEQLRPATEPHVFTWPDVPAAGSERTMSKPRKLAIAALSMLLAATAVRADCPADGDGGDRELNALKNRGDQPGKPTAMDVGQILALQGPATRARRAHWTAAQRSAIADVEGAGVVVVGYLLGAKQEGPESANCHGADRDDRDVHLWLAAAPGDPKARAVVVEITPRQHDRRWTLAALRELARQHRPVRVTGWLMFDEEHGPDVGRSRGTLWEIHPITGIEQVVDGRWQSL